MFSLSSKLSLHKLALLRSHTLRTFSTNTTTNPYLMFSAITCREEYPEFGLMTELQLLMFDPAKQEFSIDDKTLPKEMVQSRLVGSSHGWGVFLKSPDSILLSDICNPSSSSRPPKIIPLHPRKPLTGSQTELVSGVAMSSSPEEQDCFTAVKYTGRLLTVDTPGLDIKGHLILMPGHLYDYFQQAKLMYSKRDQRFYMPSSGGHHLWSYDGLQSDPPRFHELRFHNLPQFSPSELHLLDSCYRTHHLVESPSGQRFLVKWYAQSYEIKTLKYDCGGTKLFMVFREEEEMNMCYTEDIGDLCMFLGNNNEPFCVEASSFPGLKPNSIYFVHQGCGVYDIATRTPNRFIPKSPPPFSFTSWSKSLDHPSLGSSLDSSIASSLVCSLYSNNFFVSKNFPHITLADAKSREFVFIIFF